MKILIFIIACMIAGTIFLFFCQKNSSVGNSAAATTARNVSTAREVTLENTDRHEDIEGEIIPQNPNDRSVAEAAVSPGYLASVLEYAVRTGNVAKVKEVLAEVPGDVDDWNWRGDIRPSEVTLEIIQVLIEEGANPNAFENGWTYTKTTPQKYEQAHKYFMDGVMSEIEGDTATAEKMYVSALQLDPFSRAKFYLKRLRKQEKSNERR